MMRRGSVAARALGSIEERITERITEFEVPALLSLLEWAGYRRSQIEFRSHPSITHQARLLQSIEFEEPPPGEATGRVTIHVNLGLLSVQTPLPSFFLKSMEQLDQDRMVDFVGFFDHVLLSARMAGLHPERDEALIPGWGRTASDRLRLTRLAAPGSLHWLFQRVFPELEVTVTRGTRRQRIPTTGLRMGATALGDGTAVGGWALVPIGGVEVRVFCNDPVCGTGTAWPLEAIERFERLLVPLLAETALTLTFVVVLRDQESWARLSDASYLGWDPIRGGPPKVEEVIAWSGDISTHPAAPHR